MEALIELEVGVEATSKARSADQVRCDSCRSIGPPWLPAYILVANRLGEPQIGLRAAQPVKSFTLAAGPHWQRGHGTPDAAELRPA